MLEIVKKISYLSNCMLQVTCALIEHENKVLICQRSERMKLPLKWEFPGGKIEDGETKEQCLIREIKEELDVEIIVGTPLHPVTHHYEDFSLQLYPFVCQWSRGSLHSREHIQTIWVAKEQLMNYDWADADLPIVKEYLNS